MNSEVLLQKFRREVVKEKAFLLSIRNETTLPESDVEAIKELLARALAGVRDVCAIYPDDRFLDKKESYTKRLVQSYDLQSSVVYLTIDQRELIKPDNAVHLELREVGLESDTEGERARANIREIKRLQEIFTNSYSPIELNIIKTITLESIDDSRAVDFVVEYSVPHIEVLQRAQNYKGAFELFNKELLTLMTESGFATNGAQFLRTEKDEWNYSLVKKDVFGAFQLGKQSIPKEHAAA